MTPVLPIITEEAFFEKSMTWRRTETARNSDAHSLSRPDPFPPDLDDLYFLYRTTREVGALSVLEFGSGYSTHAFALALKENSASFDHLDVALHPDRFTLLTIDAEELWSHLTEKSLANSLRPFCRFIISPVVAEDLNGIRVSSYSLLPAFVPDIIYVDGPHPQSLSSSVGGFLPNRVGDVPILADVVKIEPYLWPNTMVILDGRTANARYLAQTLKRTWNFLTDPFGDRTVMRLEEADFGSISRQVFSSRLDYRRRLNQHHALRG